MDREAQSWDGTHLAQRVLERALPHAFAFSGTLIESGYPRNDVLVNAPSAAADRARRQLGLTDETRKILLYAPTWRDDRYSGRPGRYQSVYHLDFDEFARALGNEYLVLVRGAFEHDALRHGCRRNPST